MRNARQQEGFTLVELLVIVVIILLLVLMSIFNVARSRMTAREQMALGLLREMTTAAQMFSVVNNRSPSNLTELSAPLAMPPYLDQEFIGDGTTVMKHGYVFTYAQPSFVTFTLHVDPERPGTTGTRFFFTDSSLVIHVSHDGPAGPEDPTL